MIIKTKVKKSFNVLTLCPQYDTWAFYMCYFLNLHNRMTHYCPYFTEQGSEAQEVK